MGQSRKGLTSITVAFDEALDSVSADNPALYTLLGGVKKRKKMVYIKGVRIKDVGYDAGAHRVTIYLAKPYKGTVEVTVRAGMVAADGASSTGASTWIVK